MTPVYEGQIYRNRTYAGPGRYLTLPLTNDALPDRANQGIHLPTVNRQMNMKHEGSACPHLNWQI